MSSIMRKTVDHVNQSGEPASNDVLEAIHAVMHAVRSHEHRTQHEGEAGLTPLEGRVLIFFARRPGATQSDLAAHSGRDKGQLARLINGLRARGGELGLATLCVGGGQGMALIIERMS